MRVLGIVDREPPAVLSVVGPEGEKVPYVRVPEYSTALAILKGLKAALLTIGALLAPMVADSILKLLGDAGTLASILKASFGDNAAILLLTPIISGLATSYLNRRKQLAIKAEVHG